MVIKKRHKSRPKEEDEFFRVFEDLFSYLARLHADKNGVNFNKGKKEIKELLERELQDFSEHTGGINGFRRSFVLPAIHLYSDLKVIGYLDRQRFIDLYEKVRNSEDYRLHLPEIDFGPEERGQ